MGKAIVKSINNPMGGTTGVGITVQQTGATGSTSQGITSPPGQVLTGTIQDVQTNAIINFSFAYGAELGLQVNSKIIYNTVTVGGQVIANTAKLTHKGEIKTINATDDGGTLVDRTNGQTISFAQTGVAESGIAVQSKVNYQTVVDPNTGNIVAVGLEVVGE